MYFRPGGLNQKEEFAYSYLTAIQYLYLKSEDKNILNFFIKNNYRNIAVCGINDFSYILANDLKGSNIEIKYFIDKNYLKYKFGINNIPVIDSNSVMNYPKVDIYVITSTYYFNNIMDNLIMLGINAEKIINLNEIVFGMECD